MKSAARALLFWGFIAIASQDIMKKKPCECIKRSKPYHANYLINSKSRDTARLDEGKSDCNVCERRKEMLRLERKKQEQLQRCPFEILGSQFLKGKTSEEIFDEFRELVVPSQNGFLDLVRGIVKTMHLSSESELLWAKAKEAKMTAKNEKSS